MNTTVARIRITSNSRMRGSALPTFSFVSALATAAWAPPVSSSTNTVPGGLGASTRSSTSSRSNRSSSTRNRNGMATASVGWMAAR